MEQIPSIYDEDDYWNTYSCETRHQIVLPLMHLLSYKESDQKI